MGRRKIDGPKATRRETHSQAKNEVMDVAAQVAFLSELTGAGLAARYAELYGHAPRSKNAAWLRKACATKLQTDAEGGLSEAAIERIRELQADTPTRQRLPRKTKAAPAPEVIVEGGTGEEIAPPVPATKERDVRLPPVGTTITKVYKGETHEVLCLEDGFEWQGSKYRSLSALARQITGSIWNGLLFFGLTGRKAEKGGAE